MLSTQEENVKFGFYQRIWIPCVIKFPINAEKSIEKTNIIFKCKKKSLKYYLL